MAQHMIAITNGDSSGIAPTTSTNSAVSAPPADEQTLVAEYEPRLNQLAFRLAPGNAHLREDLFQEGATALVCAARRFNSERGVPFGAFAYLQMEGRMRNWLRAERSQSRCVSMEEAFCRRTEDNTADDDCLPVTTAEIHAQVSEFFFQVELRFLQQPLWEFQQTLTEKQRAIFTLRYRDGIAPSEIARQLGISAARVTQVLTEAIAKMQKVFLESQISA